ncbi:ATP-binding protein [Streptomyces oceani]|uniref:Histidine kinase/HSP90-like ATPase domain-containing protein n=1 Tax=Streptomyces oceani TaxID=1075402 RepID=A0A1E7JVR6_9ACTN|nr:ATP-binding protein [Streptomyces oceani]OEU94778.1 hypothetical protein AN216_24255 [Streptomyces oceani]
MGTEGSTVIEPLRNVPSVLDAAALPDSAALSGSASCALPGRYEAVRTAREFTRTTLHRWELTRTFDDVALVVSELVTNALRHGLPRRCAQAAEPHVRLQLMRWSSRLVCAVRDPSLEPPEATARESADRLADAGTPAGDGEWSIDPLIGLELLEQAELTSSTAESGRGLWLVDSFSDGWGWHRLSAPSGKVVWAVFRLRAAS